jgi:hypothetical protein
MMQFWLGVMTCAWLCQSLVLAYVIYRYVYLPWKVVRRDFAAIGQKFTEYDKSFEELKGAFQAKRLIAAMTDEELAMAEMKAKAREHARPR